MQELPFMATENILMHAVKRGGNRQALHESLRRYSRETIEQMRSGGSAHDLIQKIIADNAFYITQEEMNEMMKEEHFIGRSVYQVEEFLHDQVTPVLKRNDHIASYTPVVFV
jgi:adenylosuccinate lyase